MSLYDNFPQEILVDLLRAYDSYISSAADAGLLTTGWTPVCVEEFYGAEYQNVWDPEKGDESFFYMYDEVEKEFFKGDETPSLPNFFYVHDALIYREGEQFMCRFQDEQEPRVLRTNIEDIEDGDAFIIGTAFPAVHTADGAAHQNMDEPDEPWIVYDAGGDSWFENDIVKPEQLGLGLSAKDFIFDEQIGVDAANFEIIDGYLWATDSLVRLLKDCARANNMSAEAVEFMENPNFYAVRDFKNNTFELMGTFDYYENETDKHKWFNLPISDSTKQTLMPLLDKYCVKQTGFTCLDFLNRVRKDCDLAPLFPSEEQVKTQSGKTSLDSIISSAAERSANKQQGDQSKSNILEK